MFGSGAEWKTSGAFQARLKAMAEACRPGSRALTSMKRDMIEIVQSDHVDKMERGVDKMGRPRAALAPSTLANKKRGPGPSLIPNGRNSRYIRNYQSFWENRSGVDVLVVRWNPDIVSKPTKKGGGGKSFTTFHRDGAKKSGTKWVLPKRDVEGITPKGWARIRERQRQFAIDLVRMGGGR